MRGAAEAIHFEPKSSDATSSTGDALLAGSVAKQSVGISNPHSLKKRLVYTLGLQMLHPFQLTGPLLSVRS